MNLKTAICDDDIQYIQTISKYIDKYEIETETDFNVSVFNSPEELIKAYKEPLTYDILFLDVEMPETNGLALAGRIRNLPDKLVKIIFISNYPEYMQESFDVQAFYYLKKPVSYEQFSRIMNMLTEELRSTASQRILIETEYGEHLVNMQDILFIEAVKSERGILRVVTAKNEFITKGLLSHYENMLEHSFFFSPHRGYIVNLHHIECIRQNNIFLDNSMVIPLSRRRDRKMRDLFAKELLTVQQHSYSQ